MSIITQMINQKKSIERAQTIASNAINIFKKTLVDLEKSNKILKDVISFEEKQIIEHEKNINTAETSILSNQHTIDKLQEFIPIA